MLSIHPSRGAAGQQIGRPGGRPAQSRNRFPLRVHNGQRPQATIRGGRRAVRTRQPFRPWTMLSDCRACRQALLLLPWRSPPSSRRWSNASRHRLFQRRRRSQPVRSPSMARSTPHPSQHRASRRALRQFRPSPVEPRRSQRSGQAWHRRRESLTSQRPFDPPWGDCLQLTHSRARASRRELGESTWWDRTSPTSQVDKTFNWPCVVDEWCGDDPVRRLRPRRQLSRGSPRRAQGKPAAQSSSSRSTWLELSQPHLQDKTPSNQGPGRHQDATISVRCSCVAMSCWFRPPSHNRPQRGSQLASWELNLRDRGHGMQEFSQCSALF